MKSLHFFRPTLRRSAAAACLSLAVFSGSSRAQTPEEPPPTGAKLVHEVSPGVFELGKMRIEKATSSVTFPGTVNMDRGTIEYLLVAPTGSAHESLLTTADVEPRDLHLAMLLVGAKGAGIHSPAAGDAPPSQLNKEYLTHAPKLKGDDVSITVSWKGADGKDKSAPVEDWLFKSDVKKPAEHGPWIYNGSMFSTDGRFLAQLEGSFVALVTNPSALINNPRKGSDDDQVWDVNAKTVPPAKTPVVITVRLLNPESDSPKKK